MELRSLYEHLQAMILEMIETLDDLRVSAEMEVFRAAEEDDGVISGIVAGQREASGVQRNGSSGRPVALLFHLRLQLLERLLRQTFSEL